MARTFVPSFNKRPIQKGITLAKLRDILQEALIEAQGDEDKSSELLDAAFYEGQTNVLTWILKMITVEPK